MAKKRIIIYRKKADWISIFVHLFGIGLFLGFGIACIITGLYFNSDNIEAEPIMRFTGFITTMTGALLAIIVALLIIDSLCKLDNREKTCEEEVDIEEIKSGIQPCRCDRFR